MLNIACFFNYNLLYNIYLQKNINRFYKFLITLILPLDNFECVAYKTHKLYLTLR